MAHLATIKQILETRPYLTERQLRRYRAERTVTTFTVARKVLFDVDSLDAYIESTRLDPTPAA